MNNQQALDRVYQYFITEQHPPGARGSKCTYAGPCAVGIFLPVELRASYDEAQSSVYYIVDKHPDIFGEADTEFLGDLQSAHDSAAADCFGNDREFQSLLYIRLQALAKAYSMSLPSNVDSSQPA